MSVNSRDKPDKEGSRNNNLMDRNAKVKYQLYKTKGKKGVKEKKRKAMCYVFRIH